KAFALGNRIFSTDWIAAPASVEYFDGLGPYFSQRSCAGCHLRDGRGRPSSGTTDEPGNLVIGLARETGEGTLVPDPVYGEQLSERALPGLAPEGHLEVTWREKSVWFADGKVVSLRRPEYKVANLGYGPIDDDTVLRPRLAPA